MSAVVSPESKPSACLFRDCAKTSSGRLSTPILSARLLNSAHRHPPLTALRLENKYSTSLDKHITLIYDTSHASGYTLSGYTESASDTALAPNCQVRCAGGD